MMKCFLAALAFVSASPALASHYSAEPVAAPSKSKIVMDDTIWYCQGSACAAGKSNSRPAIVCASLAKKVGALRSFSVGGEPLDPTALQKCNARAR